MTVGPLSRRPLSRRVTLRRAVCVVAGPFARGLGGVAKGATLEDARGAAESLLTGGDLRTFD